MDVLAAVEGPSVSLKGQHSDLDRVSRLVVGSVGLDQSGLDPGLVLQFSPVFYE